MMHRLVPTSSSLLERLFPERPHPLSSRHTYFLFFIGQDAVGYVGLGYGVKQSELLSTLFRDPPDVSCYRELVRTYCRRTFRNAPSQMLAATVRLMRQRTKLSFLYTTGAGFQGLTGRIYQAANFKFIGSFRSHVYYLPGRGYIHPRSANGRYSRAGLGALRGVFPDLVKRVSPIFRYIYFLRDEADLMARARFTVQPNPRREDIVITEHDGVTVRRLSYEQAYAPIVPLPAASTSPRLPLRRSSSGRTPGHQPGDGGSKPTPTLHPATPAPPAPDAQGATRRRPRPRAAVLSGPKRPTGRGQARGRAPRAARRGAAKG